MVLPMTRSSQRSGMDEGRTQLASLPRTMAYPVLGLCQEASDLPSEDPVRLAALMYATAHGAVDLALSGHTDESKGLGDPPAPIQLLLARLRVSRTGRWPQGRSRLPRRSPGGAVARGASRGTFNAAFALF
jgi:hypothetical protein